MNREIKFRAFDDQDKKMFYDVLLANEGQYIGLSYTADEDELEGDYVCYDNSNNHVHVMQYTGLRDKDGKEIYEGDILNVPLMTGHGISGKTKNFNCPVSFHSNAQFGFDMPKDYGSYRFHPNINQCEIIGDIYRNPELLNPILPVKGE